jgi:hypothetical protein
VTSGSSLPVVPAGPDHPKVVHPRGSQPHAPRARLMVFKSMCNSLTSSLATWAFGVGAHHAEQDHPVYIPRPQLLDSSPRGHDWSCAPEPGISGRQCRISSADSSRPSSSRGVALPRAQVTQDRCHEFIHRRRYPHHGCGLRLVICHEGSLPWQRTYRGSPPSFVYGPSYP